MSPRLPSRAVPALLLALAAPPVHTAADPPLPATLADTGFFQVAATEFTPAYPLWTDGQSKRRWIHLPGGASIDTSDPDRWEFPRGTRAWKEFSDAGRIETRFVERLSDGSWRFATYLWNAQGTEATLAPERGVPARGIPARADCLACHEGAPVPILGFSAVQLGARIDARSEDERAALGYLHGNCGHCHNESALGATGLFLAQRAAAPAESAAKTRASVAGRAAEILRRMESASPYVRMPPIGVSIADARGHEPVQRWIHNDLQHPRENAR